MSEQKSESQSESQSEPEKKVILFYTDNKLVKDTFSKRKYWVFNPDRTVRNDFVFRLKKENLHLKKGASMRNIILWKINGKYNMFKVFTDEKCQYIPKTYLDINDFDKNESFKSGNKEGWFYKKSNASCGTDVHICFNKTSLKNRIKGDAKYNAKYVIQKQVSDPMLYVDKEKPDLMGRKFDLRVYLVIDMKLNVYMYNDFLVRICRQSYDKSSTNSKVQLTNIAQGAEMILFSKWTGAVSKIEINSETKHKSNIVDAKHDIFSSVKKSVKELAPILQKLSKQPFRKNFTLLGCDYIIDSNGDALLLEVNDKPILDFHKEFPDFGNVQCRMMNDFAKYFVEPYILRNQYIVDKKNWILI